MPSASAGAVNGEELGIQPVSLAGPAGMLVMRYSVVTAVASLARNSKVGVLSLVTVGALTIVTTGPIESITNTCVAVATLPASSKARTTKVWTPSFRPPGRSGTNDEVSVTNGPLSMPHSVVTASGEELEVDTIIFGTGFHVTDLPIAERLLDGEGVSIAERAAGSPQAFRGTSFPGYPNLFMLLGPNTGLGHMSVVFMAEAQADYIAAALRRMRSEGIASLEVREQDLGVDLLAADVAVHQRLVLGLLDHRLDEGATELGQVVVAGLQQPGEPGHLARLP